MYNLYSDELNRRMAELAEMGLVNTAFQGPGYNVGKNLLHAPVDSTGPVRNPGGSTAPMDLGPFQGLANAKPVQPR
jgi:hypothetical protein